MVLFVERQCPKQPGDASGRPSVGWFVRSVKRIGLLVLVAMLPSTVNALTLSGRARPWWWWGVFGLALIGVGIALWQWFKVYQTEVEEGETPEGTQRRNQLIIYTTAIFLGLIVALILLLLPSSAAPSLPLDEGGLRGLRTRQGSTLIRSMPRPGQTNLPRNTHLYLWFSGALKRSSILDDRGTATTADDRIQEANIRLYLTSKPQDPPVKLRARLNRNEHIVAFDPEIDLGQEGSVTGYTLELKGIQTSEGRPALGTEGAFSISFTVGPTVDHEAPVLTYQIPREGLVRPANSGLQWWFNKELDPISIEEALHIRADGRLIVFTSSLSVGGKVFEAFGDDVCTLNKCGQDVGCWIFNKAHQWELQPIHVNEYPYKGIGDLFGNPLSSPGASPLIGTWKASDQIDRVSPSISAVRPKVDESGVAVDRSIEVDFSQSMSMSSLTAESVILRGDGEITLEPVINSTTGVTTLRILHDPFSADAVLHGLVTSGARALNQQCFLPCTGP